MPYKLKAVFLGFALALILVSNAFADRSFLNVSFDPTRGLFEQINEVFIKDWQQKHREKITINQSHGPSGKQARSVIEGLSADVVSLGLSDDIDKIAATGLLDKEWATAYPNSATPYYSTVVFLVRQGNPKHISDWSDLIKGDTKIITLNPKTSSGGRWNYLAAYAFALKKNNNDEQKAREFLKEVFKRVPVLENGARAATTTFVQRQIGDVMITWESEALMAQQKMPGQFEIVYPSLSIAAKTPVAIITANANRHGTTDIAKAYLDFLYSTQGQEIIAQHFFRPFNAGVLAAHEGTFKKIDMVTVESMGGWKIAQKKYFADGGVFDQIYESAR